LQSHQSIQYLILSPTYTNVINVYAFCNVHDVTWGTRDAPKEEKKNSVNSKEDGNVEVTMGLGDLNIIYDEALTEISHKEREVVKEPSKSDLEMKDKDSYAAFRSYVVLTWMFCNAALVAIVLNAGGLNRLKVNTPVVEEGTPTESVVVYLKIVLWSVAWLSGFKFIGAMVYTTKRIVSEPPTQSNRPLLIHLLVGALDLSKGKVSTLERRGVLAHSICSIRVI
jgi:chitin synthase